MFGINANCQPVGPLKLVVGSFPGPTAPMALAIELLAPWAENLGCEGRENKGDIG